MKTAIKKAVKKESKTLSRGSPPRSFPTTTKKASSLPKGAAAQVLASSSRLHVRWSEDEWKAVINHALPALKVAEFKLGQKPQRGDQAMQIQEFLTLGQEALPKERRRKKIASWTFPDMMLEWCCENGIEFDTRPVQAGTRLIRMVRWTFPEPMPPMEQNEFKDQFVKDVDKCECAERPLGTPQCATCQPEIPKGDITDLYLVVCEIRDELRALKAAMAQPAPVNWKDEPEDPCLFPEGTTANDFIASKVVKKKLPRILVIGFLPRQKDELQRRFSGQATILNSWHPESGSARGFPFCNYVVATTRFISHSKFHKTKALAEQIGAKVHFTSGVITSSAGIISEIIKTHES